MIPLLQTTARRSSSALRGQHRQAQNILKSNYSTTSEQGEGLVTGKMSGRKVLFVTGGRGTMAKDLIKKAVAEGWDVVSTSRNPEKLVDSKHHKFEVSSESDTRCREYWTQLIEKHSQDAKEVAFVNTIGVTHAPPGQTIFEVNSKPVFAMADALQTIAKVESSRKFRFVQLSSMAAAIIGSRHPYGEAKLRVDEGLMEKAGPMSVVCLRPDQIFTDFIVEKDMHTLFNGHAYGPEQMATMPLHFIIGSGDQITQPVYAGDVTSAALNAASQDITGIIDAVGPVPVSQRELLRFHAALAGKKFREIKLPYELVQSAAEHFSKGKFNEFCVLALKILDEDGSVVYSPKPFEQLVGKPLTSMESLYVLPEGATLALPRPPIAQHLMESLNKFARCSETRNAFTSGLISDIGTLVRNRIDS